MKNKDKTILVLMLILLFLVGTSLLGNIASIL